MATTYRIVDEPRPTGLAHLAVSPFWIVMALMLGGAWIGFPWFALNAFAIGSAARKKELAMCVAGLVGAAALTAIGLQLVTMGVLNDKSFRYAATLLVLWKLGVGYFLYASQSLSHELYTYFGGPSRNGMLVGFGALFARPAVLDLIGNPFWIFVLM